MNRNSIIQALDTIAKTKGYTLYTDADSLLPQRLKSFPAIWLSPLKFKSMEGRKHGKITYLLSLKALTQAAKLPPADHEGVWAKMEDDVLEIFSALSQQERVIAIENLSLKSNFATLTSHGELSLEATAEVITFF